VQFEKEGNVTLAPADKDRCGTISRIAPRGSKLEKVTGGMVPTLKRGTGVAWKAINETLDDWARRHPPKGCREMVSGGEYMRRFHEWARHEHERSDELKKLLAAGKPASMLVNVRRFSDLTGVCVVPSDREFVESCFGPTNGGTRG
jgi:hypothetical protein